MKRESRSVRVGIIVLLVLIVKFEERLDRLELEIQVLILCCYFL
jgi:hypothetical protein